MIKKDFNYRKVYLDGYKDGQKIVVKEIIDLIENGFVESLEDLKKVLTKN